MIVLNVLFLLPQAWAGPKPQEASPPPEAAANAEAKKESIGRTGALWGVAGGSRVETILVKRGISIADSAAVRALPEITWPLEGMEQAAMSVVRA